MAGIHRMKTIMADAEILICNKSSINLISKRVSAILYMLEKYSYLINSFVIDFFVDDLWDKVPVEWQNTLENVDPLTLSAFLDSSKPFKPTKSVWPLSLLSFRAAAYALSLSRSPIDTMELIYNYVQIKQCNENEGSNDSSHNIKDSEELENTKKNKILNRGVKLKKRHEISKLSRIVKIVSTIVDCNRVIDVGSGQGHLSRNLAFEGNFHVTSFDAEDCHVSAAKKLDDKVKSAIQKQSKSDLDLSLTHVAKFIPSGINEEDFMKLLEIEDKNVPVTSFMLLGLHTCGSLASSMVEVFSRCPSAVALLSVSCCYMKLDSQSYPLSEKLKNLPNSNLSYHAREASCHAIEKHVNKLKCGEMTFLKIHCYRATLESLIVKYYPLKKHLGLRSVKNAHEMTFTEYAKTALHHCGLRIPEEEFTSQFVLNCMKKWKLVIVFYFLRLFLAMLVESVILLDKTVFLNEKNLDSCLIPLFDPKLSPRNFLLLALKK